MQSFCTLVVMDSQPTTPRACTDTNLLPSPHSTLTNETGASSTDVRFAVANNHMVSNDMIIPTMGPMVSRSDGISNIGNMISSDSAANYNMNNTNDYAEITTVFNRTMKETALQQIQREIEEQLNRLKNLNNKEFLAEMEVIKNNLNLSDNQMVDILLMTLREVPIRYRNCPCGLFIIHIKQKYNNYLFTTQQQSNDDMNTPYSHTTNNTTPYYDHLDRNDDIESTPPTPETSTKIKKYPNVNSFKQLFNNQSNSNQNQNGNQSENNVFDTPQTTDKPATDIDSILESEEMDYKLENSNIKISNDDNKSSNNNNNKIDTTHTTRTTHMSYDSMSNSNYNQYQETEFIDANNNNNHKMYIDTVADTENEQEYIINNLCLKIFYKFREFILFFIPFIHTFILSLISLIIFLEILTDSYNKNDEQCNICYNIHNVFYGNRLDYILNNGTQFELQCFYILLLLRMTTILCWYILLIHTLLFNPITCCNFCCIDCFCQIEMDCNNNCCCKTCNMLSDKSTGHLYNSTAQLKYNYSHYHIMNKDSKYNQTQQQRKKTKYSTHQNTTILMNCSLSIDQHLRSKSRTITSLNILKFYLRMVIIPNCAAIIIHILLFDQYKNIHSINSENHVNFYLNIAVLFGFYWSLSDWFYFNKENILVKWYDVYIVFTIDLITNWIKLLYEIVNFIFFLALAILTIIPLTVFILLRIICCPCFFGYNNAAACVICNLYENCIEFILKIIKKCYI